MEDSKNRNLQWKKTCDQLKSAFDSWVELNEKDPELSADEKRWNEMKALLKDLKGKLEELSSSSPPDKPETSSQTSAEPEPTPEK